jgi:hypothetical protein
VQWGEEKKNSGLPFQYWNERSGSIAMCIATGNLNHRDLIQITSIATHTTNLARCIAYTGDSAE